VAVKEDRVTIDNGGFVTIDGILQCLGLGESRGKARSERRRPIKASSSVCGLTLAVKNGHLPCLC
jgi:hypothetical protein